MSLDSLAVNLTNKVALITGSAHGLGAYYAEVLAKNGAQVILTGRASSVQQLDMLVMELIKKGYKASRFIVDMLDLSNFTGLVDDIKKQFGRIDILINNAAVSIDKDIFEISESDWDLHMNTNLKGLFFLSQVVAKQMKNQPTGGNIINVAAINGAMIRKNCIAFGTSKAAVIHLTKAMAYELIEYKIKVNGLLLGLIESSSTVKEFLANDPKATGYINQIPIKRPGKPEDIEGPLLLLASDASNYMYGTILNVDGGFSIDVFMDIDIKA